MAQTGSTKRLQKELLEFQKKPIEGVTASLVEDNIYNWELKIAGPAGSPYEGGVFVLSLQFLQEYPCKSPYVAFKTKIYHPNVHVDGSICLMCMAKWTPTMKVSKIVAEVLEVLARPNAEHAVTPEIGSAYNNNRAAFEDQARKWTAQYAH